MKSISKNLALVAGLLFLQPLISPDGSAHARRKAVMRGYSFITVEGKASQGDCDGETKIPRRLKSSKDVVKGGTYLGSELMESDFKDPNAEMWKHFFKNKAACNASLAKAPSARAESQKANPADLPPEEVPAEEEDSARSDSE